MIVWSINTSNLWQIAFREAIIVCPKESRQAFWKLHFVQQLLYTSRLNPLNLLQIAFLVPISACSKKNLPTHLQMAFRGAMIVSWKRNPPSLCKLHFLENRFMVPGRNPPSHLQISCGNQCIFGDKFTKHFSNCISWSNYCLVEGKPIHFGKLHFVESWYFGQRDIDQNLSWSDYCVVKWNPPRHLQIAFRGAMTVWSKKIHQTFGNCNS